jgi:acyl-CoA reductase-like NAD-dependent aldehyde dehydrogenase
MTIATPRAPRVRTAHAVASAWADTPLVARARILREGAALIAADADALVQELGAADGRAAQEAWSAEILPTLDALRWLTRDGARALTPRRLGRARVQWYVRRTRHELHWDPRGVVGVVTPSNSLLFLAVPQVAAALLAGNTVRWKPAPPGARLAHRIAATLRRAGLPDGTLEVVEGGAEAGRALVRAGVDLLHFTGSAPAGRQLARLHAERGGPAVLELSGHHAALVLGDADLALAARGIAWGALANAGRNCLSVRLVLAEHTIAPPLVEALVDALEVRAAADGVVVRDAVTTARLAELVDDAQTQGADVVWRAPGGAALLKGVRRGMRMVDEDVNGPVLGVATVTSASEAIRWVNAAPFRLSASVWCRHPAHGHAIARRLDVGQVWINEQLQPAAQPEVPLAGRGASGFGASRGVAGLMEMVTPKVISTTSLRARRRHYEPTDEATIALLRATVGLAFTSGRERLAALAAAVRALRRLAWGTR